MHAEICLLPTRSDLSRGKGKRRKFEGTDAKRQEAKDRYREADTARQEVKDRYWKTDTARQEARDRYKDSDNIRCRKDREEYDHSQSVHDREK